MLNGFALCFIMQIFGKLGWQLEMAVCHFGLSPTIQETLGDKSLLFCGNFASLKINLI